MSCERATLGAPPPPRILRRDQALGNNAAPVLVCTPTSFPSETEIGRIECVVDASSAKSESLFASVGPTGNITRARFAHFFSNRSLCCRFPPLFSSALCRAAVAILLVLLLSPLAWKVLLFLKMVLAAAKVVFFPYSMVGSREDFKLG